MLALVPGAGMRVFRALQSVISATHGIGGTACEPIVG
jgi:hypothetical protein